MMKSHLTFLIAVIAAGSSLVFSAAKAQELPAVLQSMWLASTTLSYDPLLVVTFILAATLAVGRTVDLIREHNDQREALTA
jgi:hypothetical protein